MKRRSKVSGKAGKAKRLGATPRLRKLSVASQGLEAARLASELSATHEILRLISDSSSNVGMVLQSVARHAAHICQAQFVDIVVVEGDQLRDVAWVGELKRTLAFPLDRSSVAGRSVCDVRPISIDDLQNASDEFARGREIACRDGHRSVLAVPLIRDGRALGTIIVRRTEIRAFEQEHIALLTTFAAQAVIAIENTRLLNELRQRTDDLTESLDQQTATAEVLGVINSSPGDLAPVFDAMLEKAMRLCEADFGFFLRYQDAKYSFAAGSGLNPAFAKYLSRMDQPGSNEANTRIILGAPYVHIVDMKDDEPYRSGAPFRRAIVDLGGGRTGLGVPMRKDHELLGTFNLVRHEVRPFTDKQIALVQNFAAQAVIAIENTRLLNELRQRTSDLSESLEQQTAASQVLQVISTSQTTVQPVLDAVVASAARLCDGVNATILIRDADVVVPHAQFGPLGIQPVGQRVPLNRDWVTGRAVLEARTIHVTDLANSDEYPQGREMAHIFGHRATLAVPLLREGTAVGAILVRRLEARPFTDKQIALV